MTAEQQLERSVLEGKERDELSAIAQAMSLKTTTRTKKADIIDQILDATGVTSGPAAASSNGDGESSGTNGAPKPARRSRASAAARGAAETASFVSGDGDDSGPDYGGCRRRSGVGGPPVLRLRPTWRRTATPDRPCSSSRPSCPTGPIPSPRPERTAPEPHEPEQRRRPAGQPQPEPEPGQPEPEPGQPEQPGEPVRRRRRQPPQPPAPRS